MSKVDPGRIAETLSRAQVQFICLNQPQYPRLLKEINDPPPVLYFTGALPDTQHSIIAVVGTRKASTYGKQCATDIVSPLARRGIVIVSGLAYGIDSHAHDAALEADGLTWAVLGGGVHCLSAHQLERSQSIIHRGGTLLSEFPPDWQPRKEFFPMRNRIIAGLVQAAVIIEAPARSGALITARFALDYNRDVLAVPADIYRASSQGCNNLIAQGAKVVTKAEDVLEALNLSAEQVYAAPQLPLSENQKKLTDLLRVEPLTVDQIAEKCTLGISVINSTLSELLLIEAIRQIDPHTYTLNL